MPPIEIFDPGGSVQWLRLLCQLTGQDEVPPGSPLTPLDLPTQRLTSVHINLHLAELDEPVLSLFDSGAETNSYADKAWVDLHRDQLGSYLSPCDFNVSMADGYTVHAVREVLTLTVRAEDPDGVMHSGVVTFRVFPMGGHLDLCVGLPDIERHFPILMCKLILKGAAERGHIVSELQAQLRPFYAAP